MPNAKKYRQTANRNKRRNRRFQAQYDLPDEDTIRLPTLAEIKDALSCARGSTEGILRLAAIMDDVSLYHSPRLICDDDFSGHTNGIRKYLAQDGYLVSRYATLMRFKKLGRTLRERSDILPSSDLLWGFLPKCPFSDEESIRDWQSIRDFFASFEGMNFKEISETIIGRENEP